MLRPDSTGEFTGSERKRGDGSGSKGALTISCLTSPNKILDLPLTAVNSKQLGTVLAFGSRFKCFSVTWLKRVTLALQHRYACGQFALCNLKDFIVFFVNCCLLLLLVTVDSWSHDMTPKNTSSCCLHLFHCLEVNHNGSCILVGLEVILPVVSKQSAPVWYWSWTSLLQETWDNVHCSS